MTFRNKVLLFLKKSLWLFLPAMVSAGLFLWASLDTDLPFSLVPDAYAGLAVLIFSVIACAALFLARNRTEIRNKLQALMLLLTPFLSFFALENCTHSPFSMKIRIIFLNLLFFALIEMILLFLSGRIGLSCTVTLLLSLAIGIVNAVAVQARSIPIYPWDVASVGVALSVASHYEFHFTFAWMISGSVTVLGILLSLFGTAKVDLKPLWKRLTALVLSLLCLGGYVLYLSTDRVWTDFGLHTQLFEPKALYDSNGFAVSFLGFLKNISVPEPDEYDAGQLREEMARYEEMARKEAASFQGDKPNIIVLMNEAFSDLSVLTGRSDWASCDPLSFLHSLSENTVSGYASVSVKGGNTPNSEFEFLTGLSMAFLPKGTVPFQQYISSPLPSIVSQLSELGYTTRAIHPYLPSGWRRDVVYPRFGFDQSLFYYDFFTGASRPSLVRNFISDDTLVDRILSECSSAEEPLFLYSVSMQNHGGYTDGGNYTNFTPDVFARGLENDEELSTYLSLIRLSDRAIEKLITSLETSDRPTVVLIFGDHQPNDSVSDGLCQLYGTDVTGSAQAIARLYKVPFVLWTNYTMESRTNVHTSLNFLSGELIRAAGLPRTAFQLFLSDLSQKYDSVSASGIVSFAGTFYEKAKDARDPDLDRYEKLQYALLFDKQLRASSWFGPVPDEPSEN